MTMGQVVKMLREKRGVSHEQLAKALDVTANYIYIIENDENASRKRHLSFEAIANLSKFFNIPAAYFFVLADDTASKDKNRSRKTSRIIETMMDLVTTDLEDR